MKLRPPQIDIKAGIYNSWNAGAQNTLAVSPTGSGKTVIFSNIIQEHTGVSCAIAHRQELVGQISLSLARYGVRHRIIGPDSVVRLISHQHQTELGRSFYDTSAMCAVAGVDTLIRRGEQLKRWLPQVTLWVQDEAHHVLRSNKWGAAAEMFPNARGLGVTATPCRADGKGLGRHADGLFDDMYVGPSAREFIDMGYLTDYRIFAPPSDLDLQGVNITGSGDYSPTQLKQRVRKSHIVGDVVDHYLRIAPFKLGVTFVDSVETAIEVKNQYCAAGIPAEVVTANTPAVERANILNRFKNRQLLQLVNVDLFGEGFDLPAIEVVSMARPTQSYSLYAQQFGRALRIMIPDVLAGAWDTYTNEQRRHFIAQSEKPMAIIIDHVGNFMRHGRPDVHKLWTLDRRTKRAKKTKDETQLKNCTNPACLGAYEAYLLACPYCGFAPEPAARTSPEFVDGDLVELDPNTLAELTSEKARIDGVPRIPQNATPLVAAGIKKNHAARQNAQGELRDGLMWWGGVHESLGYSLRESQKIFFLRFGVDVMTAQTYGRPDAEKLHRLVWDDIQRLCEKHNLINELEAV